MSDFPSGSGSRSPGPSNSSSSGDWDGSYPSGERGLGTCRSVLPRTPPLSIPDKGQGWPGGQGDPGWKVGCKVVTVSPACGYLEYGTSQSKAKPPGVGDGVQPRGKLRLALVRAFSPTESEM